MSKHEATELTNVNREEFEAPELTVIGDASDIVLGIPMSGGDHHGLAEPEFEFESDEEQG